MIKNDYKCEEYLGCNINVYYDQDAESPRTWDNVSHMICFGNKQWVGDRHGFQDWEGEYGLLNSICYEVDPKFCESFDWYYGDTSEVMEHLENLAVIMPISCYEHGGITVWLGSPNDRWDSGYIGICYMTREEAYQNLGGVTSSNWKEKAVGCMEAEIHELDQYVRGEVYGIEVTDDDGNEVIDTMWGVFEGDLDDYINDAKAQIEQYVEKREVEQEIAAEEAMLPVMDFQNV